MPKTAKKAAKKAVKPKNPAKDKKPYISAKALAERLSVTKQRISRAIDDGLFSEKAVKKVQQGKRIIYQVDEALAIREWHDNIDPSKQRDTGKAAATREMGGESVSGGNYKKAKTATEVYRAKMAQLEYSIKAGEYIPAAQVKADAYKIARRVRDSLMAVPDRVSAELVSMDDPRKISIYIKEQIALSLKDLGDLNGISKRS